MKLDWQLMKNNITLEDLRILIEFLEKEPRLTQSTNVEAFERVGVAAIERAIHESALIVMDELGRMELFSRRFQQVALRALDSPRRVLGVLQDRHTSFLDGIRARDDVEIITVTPENRDGLVAVLRERLGS